MTIMLFVSLCVGVIGGAAYAYAANSYTKALLAGEVKDTFGARIWLVFGRMAAFFCVMALVLWTGAFASSYVGMGIAIGFIGFHAVCAVSKWM